MSAAAFWLAPTPLVLASASRVRAALLCAAGIPIDIVPAEIDERIVEAPLLAEGAEPITVALHLARAKAIAVGVTMPDRVVVGADQVLALGSEVLAKPADLAVARERLRRLAGTTHVLHTGAVVVQGGEVLETVAQKAVLTMRPLTEDFLERYLAIAGPDICASVGAYQLEGLGANLFSDVTGDYFAVLGLPLLPLLAVLRARGFVAA